MIAIDTNIVVRLVMDEPADQAARAVALLAEGPVYVPYTVLLEAEWVLRSRFGLPRGRVVEALESFSQLPAVRLEHPERVSRALKWAASGMETADAFHLASARDAASFASFDRKMQRRASRLGVKPAVIEP